MHKISETSIHTRYRPELEVSPELGPNEDACFQCLIGVLCQMLEFGRFEIFLQESMTHSHLALPREECLTQTHSMISQFKKYHNAELTFYPSNTTVYASKFECRDWTLGDFGHVLKE